MSIPSRRSRCLADRAWGKERRGRRKGIIGALSHARIDKSVLESYEVTPFLKGNVKAYPKAVVEMGAVWEPHHPISRTPGGI